MVRAGGINRLNPYLARDLIDNPRPLHNTNRRAMFFMLGYFLVNCKESIGPPLDDLFLSSQVRESQEIVKKKVNFQFLHYL